ncbi:MAG: DUF998 domain-containing protein, partial [Promethearchaeota archaeon]
MLSPIIYAMIWILGGILQPEYSHIRDDVSSLMAVGAPNKLLFDIMRTIDVILMIVFSIGLYLVMKELNASIIGPVLFLVSNFIGLLVVFFFPLDEGGEINTLTGQMHFILVVIMGFIAMGGMIALWRGLRKIDEWKGYDKYSLIVLILTFTSSLVLVFTSGTEIMGLTERISVTLYGQYFFVIALKTYL